MNDIYSHVAKFRKFCEVDSRKMNEEDILIFQILFNLPLLTKTLGSGICNPNHSVFYYT